ncbi:probable xyloglucan endotransglucosylase/hydrolase protein 30 [Salvia miltiorrhiza]|uniref:probable xyloglucan endotransglucosylase/hydrolase protein 30 n=1 Tax=Salvia miltiorrhiza TaxID=226208 RepID=UPI0025AB6B74|nr:probable xyloglucan endotransglucosylase/hydrolase protein 30 [Salvia miltiorrhiza]
MPSPSLRLLFLLSTSSLLSSTAFNLTTLTFSQSYTPLFSDFNIKRSPDDNAVSLLLNRLSGSGIISSDYYNYGFFSASIKMPSKYTAGIVVAFYTSNVDTFEKNHDELDIEFLGNVQGHAWRFQTNLYGNGSVSRGREERYRLWFDPSKDSHRYSILWTPQNIIFYVDEIPIRHVIRNAGMRGDYPSKPMSVYATIWDASSWATSGGKRKVDYRHQPFIAEFRDLVLQGCVVDPVDQLQSSNCTDHIAALMVADYSTITADRRKSMQWFRQRYMYYSYCYDNVRYPVPPPECVDVPSEREILMNGGRRGAGRSNGRRGRGGERRSKGTKYQAAR